MNRHPNQNSHSNRTSAAINRVKSLNDYRYKQIRQSKDKILSVLKDGNFTKLEILARVENVSNATIERYLKSMHDAQEISRIRVRGLEYLYGLPGEIIIPTPRPKKKKIRKMTRQQGIAKTFRFIKNNPRCTIKEIRAHIQVTIQLTSNYVRTLKKDGLVKCELTFDQKYVYQVCDNDTEYEVDPQRMLRSENIDKVLDLINGCGTYLTSVQISEQLDIELRLVKLYIKTLRECKKIQSRFFSTRQTFYASLDFDVSVIEPPAKKLKPEKQSRPKKDPVARLPRVKKPKKVSPTEQRKVNSVIPKIKARIQSVETVSIPKQDIDNQSMTNVIRILSFSGVATIEQLLAADGVSHQLIDYMIRERYIVMDRSIRPVKYRLAGAK